MLFSIEHGGKNYNCNLGDSPQAAAAISAYAAYGEHPDHDHVIPVFARLCFLTSRGNQVALQALIATRVLATKLLETEQDPYRRIYLVNCVTSIYGHCHRDAPAEWMNAAAKAIRAVSGANFDQQRAEAAGLAVVRPQVAEAAGLKVLDPASVKKNTDL